MKTTLTLVLLLAVASHADAARWKTGTGPAGAQTRASYDPKTGNPNGSCYYDTADSGPDQCRYKSFNADGSDCRFVTEAGPTQCTPGQTTAPSEYVRFEGAKAHLHSYDGTLTFDKTVDSGGAMTLSWKMAAETVVMTVNGAGMSVTRNGVRLAVGASATDAQMKAIGTMLNNSAAITRFRLNAVTKLAKAKARAANIVLTAQARAAEDGYIGSGALVSSLSGDSGAINAEGPDHSGGQVDCTTRYEQAVWQYFMDYESCYKAAISFDGHPGWYAGSMAGETWACAMAYTMRAEGAWFQFLGCMSIPRI